MEQRAPGHAAGLGRAVRAAAGAEAVQPAHRPVRAGGRHVEHLLGLVPRPRLPRARRPQAIVARVPRRRSRSSRRGRRRRASPSTRRWRSCEDACDAGHTEAWMADPLASWNDTPTRRRSSTSSSGRGAGDVPPEERVAVFDNDGTLWCEKPMPIQLGFILRAARRDGRGRTRRCATASRGRRPTRRTTAGSAAP